MTESTGVSAETLKLANVATIVNGSLAALGIAIACYVYFCIPHLDEIRYAGKYGDVVSGAATYIFVYPAFQIWVFVLSVIGRRGASRRDFFDDFKLWNNWPRPAPREQAVKVACIGIMVIGPIIFVATISRSVALAYSPPAISIWPP